MFKKKSKFIAISLIIGMLVTGCGSAASTTKETAPTKKADLIQYNLLAGKPFAGKTVKVLCAAGTAAQFVLMQKFTPEFTDLTGIKVVWDFTAYGAYQEKFMTEATAGGGNYDMMPFIDAWGAAAKSYLLPLNDYIKRDGIDMADYPNGFLDAAKLGTDKYYGIPFRGHALVLYYRKDIFQKLGLNPPKTWDELVDDSKKIEQSTGKKGLAVPFGINAGQNLMPWFGMLWGNGSDLFDKDWNPTFNNAKGVEATQKYVDFLTKDKIVPSGAATMNESDANNEMLQGRAAMNINWTHYYAKFIDPKLVVPDLLHNVGIASVPMFSGQTTPANYSTSWSLAISSDSKNKDAAWEYMKFLTSKEVEKKTITGDKSSYAVNNVVTNHMSNMTDPDVNKANDGLQSIMVQELKSGKGLPVTPQWLQIQSVLEVAMNKMATGAPVQSTLDKAASDIKDIMQRAGYYKK